MANKYFLDPSRAGGQPVQELYDTINYLSGIMSEDFEITDVDKCIEDVIVAYRKELLLQKRNEILNKIDKNDLTKEESASLEAELNDVIIKLAKMKQGGLYW